MEAPIVDPAVIERLQCTQINEDIYTGQLREDEQKQWILITLYKATE